MTFFRISLLLALLMSPMTALGQERSAADQELQSWKDHIALTIHRSFEKYLRNVTGLPRANAVVEITVKPNGEIVGTRMYKSSGIDKLDRATQLIVMSAGPFRPAPASRQRLGPTKFTVPVAYNNNPWR